jgi:hypothetical protein
MPTLTPEQRDAPVMRVVGERVKRRLTKKTWAGISILTAWGIASVAVSQTEDAPTSAKIKPWFPSTIQSGFNMFVNHPYRIGDYLVGMVSEAADGFDVEVQTPSGAGNTKENSSQTDNAPADTLPTIGTAPAPVPQIAPPAGEVSQEPFSVDGKYPYGVLRSCGLLPEGGFPADPVQQEILFNNQWGQILKVNPDTALPANGYRGGVLEDIVIVCPAAA